MRHRFPYVLCALVAVGAIPGHAAASPLSLLYAAAEPTTPIAWDLGTVSGEDYLMASIAGNPYFPGGCDVSAHTAFSSPHSVGLTIGHSPETGELVYSSSEFAGGMFDVTFSLQCAVGTVNGSFSAPIQSVTINVLEGPIFRGLPIGYADVVLGRGQFSPEMAIAFGVYPISRGGFYEINMDDVYGDVDSYRDADRHGSILLIDAPETPAVPLFLLGVAACLRHRRARPIG